MVDEPQLRLRHDILVALVLDKGALCAQRRVLRSLELVALHVAIVHLLLHSLAHIRLVDQAVLVSRCSLSEH